MNNAYTHTLIHKRRKTDRRLENASRFTIVEQNVVSCFVHWMNIDICLCAENGVSNDSQIHERKQRRWSHHRHINAFFLCLPWCDVGKQHLRCISNNTSIYANWLGCVRTLKKEFDCKYFILSYMYNANALAILQHTHIYSHCAGRSCRHRYCRVSRLYLYVYWCAQTGNHHDKTVKVILTNIKTSHFIYSLFLDRVSRFFLFVYFCASVNLSRHSKRISFDVKSHVPVACVGEGQFANPIGILFYLFSIKQNNKRRISDWNAKLVQCSFILSSFLTSPCQLESNQP